MASGALPRRRSGYTTAVTISAERFYLTANQRDDGSLGEVFLHWGKHGTSSAGLVSTYAIALSIGLRHRVPLAELIRPGLGQYFLPNGRTDDPEIPSAWPWTGFRIPTAPRSGSTRWPRPSSSPASPCPASAPGRDPQIS